jgi:hypothetical protein
MKGSRPPRSAPCLARGQGSLNSTIDYSGRFARKDAARFSRMAISRSYAAATSIKALLVEGSSICSASRRASSARCRQCAGS